MDPRSDPRSGDSAWFHRYRAFRLKFALVVGAAALILGAMIWSGKKLLSVAPTSSVPFGECVRTGSHIATLLRTTDPHLPEITGRGGHTTTSISILLIPLSGGGPKKIPIAEGLRSEQFALARILGGDGSTLWFDVNGVGGVDLRRMELLDAAEVREARVPRGSRPLAISPDTYLSAGLIVAPGTWFGLHSEEEVRVGFAPGKFVRRVVPQESRKQMRRFHRGTLDEPVNDRYHRILSLEPMSAAEYFNAAFLRMDDASEPVRLSDPEGALMIHTSEPGLNGTAVVSRVDLNGTVRWTVDTAIDRFKLTQILPCRDAFAFVGTRLPVPGRVSEPLLVIVDLADGRVVTHSLWR